MDSTDVKMINKKGKRKKGKDFNFKENSKERRYMLLLDGKKRVRKWWGGYSPKVYDGDFLMINRSWFEKRLKGAGVVADQHFELGRNLKRVTFYTKQRKSMKEDNSKSENDQTMNLEGEEHSKQDCVDYSRNTKKERSYNRALYAIRARVKCSFSVLRTIFPILGMHWRKSETVLDKMIAIAIGVYNHKLH